jgi:hypothetical protein
MASQRVSTRPWIPARRRLLDERRARLNWLRRMRPAFRLAASSICTDIRATYVSSSDAHAAAAAAEIFRLNGAAAHVHGRIGGH